MDWQEELQEAKDLFESGIISKEDFEELKAECLRKRDTLVSYGLAEGAPSADSENLELVHISAGSFMMGVLSGGQDPNDWATPRHEVEISRDFYVGKYQVTQKLWKEVMGNNPSQTIGENHPVTKMNWFKAIEFCNKLSEKEGKESVYTINGENVTCNWEAKGYRLLTESEWEYCARGGEEHHYAGSNDVDEVAWHSEGARGNTHPVGQKKPNGFGLHDMSGNACEWVWDWLGYKEYQKRSGKAVDPKGTKKDEHRVFRGGSYFEKTKNQQCCYRNGLVPKHGQPYLGFRIMIPA